MILLYISHLIRWLAVLSSTNESSNSILSLKKMLYTFI
nr:MAG TPA: hypothetical protein [Caudoviricetes sp.]